MTQFIYFLIFVFLYKPFLQAKIITIQNVKTNPK